jgi:ferredoxin
MFGRHIVGRVDYGYFTTFHGRVRCPTPAGGAAAAEEVVLGFDLEAGVQVELDVPGRQGNRFHINIRRPAAEKRYYKRMNQLLIATGLIIFLLTAGASIVSFREGERRAAGRIFLAGLFLSLIYTFAGFFSFPFHGILSTILILSPTVAIVALFIPFGIIPAAGDDTPTRRIDERDIMFSRRRLVPGTDRFADYYRRHPDKKALDDRFRAKPGLLAKGSAFHDRALFSAAEASFTAVEAFQAGLDRDPAPDRVDPDPGRITGFIKWWAGKLGAMSVGVTELKEYHLYSHIGRGEPYGQPVELKHRFAIALTVEMDKRMLDHAPQGPMVMESAQQYLNSGAIAVQIAAFIRNLGHLARAHIDGNYRVVCPLVARDAGLGEFGRMGLLMTPELGPRVRLAVVTTDLPLVTDPQSSDASVIDFCARCKKCAAACPSKAIPFGDKADINGVKRWQIDSEACFTFWCHAGTDCGRCVRVCPYSHPDNLLHNLVRFGVRHSPLFRAIAVKMDDIFYGSIPPSLPLPNAMDLKPDRSSGQEHDR